MFYQRLRSSGKGLKSPLIPSRPAYPKQALTSSELPDSTPPVTFTEMSSAEQMIFKEVAVVLTQHSVTDRGYLYNKITHSLWNGEQDLQSLYDRQIAKAKQEKVWSSIHQNAVISHIQQHRKTLLQEVTSIFEKHHIVDSNNLVKRLVDHLMAGEGVVEILGTEISQDEYDEVKPQLTELMNSGKYQLPPHITPSLYPPPIQLEPPPPVVDDSAPPSPPLLSTNVREIPSIEWIPIFQRHSVLWKYSYSDFCKIEEWATYGFPTRQMPRVVVEECKDIPSFNHRLYTALFFLIKRQLDLSPFVDALLECFVDYGVECEQYSLRMFINLLLANCDELLRQKVIYYTSAANPVPLTEFTLDENGASFSQQFIPEPYWLLEDKFLFFSYGIDNSKGKSSILNRIFATTFEISKDSQFFKGTIDYQGDRLFTPSRGVVVADGHGVATAQFKLGLLSIADGAILHVQNDLWSTNPIRVRQEVDLARRYGVKFIVLLVRDVVELRNRRVLDGFEAPDLASRLGTFEGDDTPILMVFKLPALAADAMVDFYVRRIRERIMECLWSRFGVRQPSVHKPVPTSMLIERKMDKSQKYLALLSTRHKNKLEDVRGGILDLMEVAETAIEQNRVNDNSFFHIYPKFKAMNELKHSLVTTRFPDAADTHMRRVLIFELSAEIGNCEADNVGTAIKRFEEALGAQNPSLLFTFMESIKKLLVSYDTNSDTHRIQDNSLKHRDIAEGKALSVELFWREINQLFVAGRRQKEVAKAYAALIQAGESFEVIDGDNLYLPLPLLYCSLKNSFATGKRVLVVGVLGPQNSGKSTLLNFMFGCSLASGNARVTKGVYGHVVESPIEEYDLILILDPEGIHCAEKRDPDFDRKVVLVMLAICDVIIVNVRDQTSDGMINSLEVCAKALTRLHNSKVPQPMIFFVQNQRPNQYIPQQALIDVIANLTQEGLGDTLSLSADNFVALPSAFHSKEIAISGADKWQKLATLPKYVEKVAAFTEFVFSKVKQRHNDFNSQGITRPFHDLPTWLQFASNVFNTAYRFDDLTRFGDLLEEKQDQFVKKWLHIIVDNIVSTEKKDNIFALSDCVEGIETYFRVATSATEHELVDMLEKNHIRTNLHRPHLDNLNVIMENSRLTWLVDATIRIENDRLQVETTNGQHRLNEKIREILRSGKKYTRDHLQAIFDECFTESYGDMNKRRGFAEANIKALCWSIVNIYKLYCTDLPNSEEVAEEIDINQDPEAKLQLLMFRLADTKYADVVYSHASTTETIDSRIISGSGWVFVNAPTIALMKEGILDYLLDHSPDFQLDDGVIGSLFVQRPISEKIVETVSKWFSTAKCMVASRNPMSDYNINKTAQLIVRSLKRTLNKSPELIASALKVHYPFDMVRSKAQEMQLQERLPSTEVIHRCVNYVNEVIIGVCDNDLKAFGLALTKTMRARLHVLMLQYLVTFNLKYHTKRMEEPVAQALRDSWKATFMEQTLRGPARDNAAVDSFVSKFEESLQRSCLDRARKAFNSLMNKLDRTSTRLQLQLQYEKTLSTRPKEDVMRYVTDPVGLVSQEFEMEWQEEEASMLEQAQLVYTIEGDNLLSLELWLAEVHRQVELAKFSNANDLFLAPTSLGAVQALLYKEKAVVLLYCDLLRGRARSHKYSVEGLDLDVVDWSVPPSEGGKHVQSLEQIIQYVQEVGTISDLLTFSGRLSARISAVGNHLRRHDCETAHLDPNHRVEIARKRAAGCDQKCPCCKRCCDEEHWWYTVPAGMGPNRHKCRLGHQYRGMAGYGFEKTKFASLKICGGMKDEEKVWHHDRYLLWSEFKAKFPTWDFHAQVHNDVEATARIAHQWATVGPDLCSEYLIQIPTTYTCFDDNKRAKHYIFIVGVTESLQHGWQYLLRAGRQFAEIKIEQDPSVSHSTSLVLFSHRATVPFKDEPLSNDLFSSSLIHPSFTGDRTNFSAALQETLNILEKQVSRIPVVIVFVSDGDDAFPQKELKKLCEDSMWKKIEGFWGVGFGTEALQGTLMGIAQWMAKGYKEKWHFLNPKDFTELVEQFTEIAQQT